MGHGKLRKFAENETFACLVQPDGREILADGYSTLRDHPLKGHWFEGSGAPIVLELGCGRGEYTVELARRHPDINYIGVDIKGARLWSGAKQATQEGLSNVRFLRTRIELITAFFAPGEISEIWLTFSDPQLGKENARLTSPLFLERYRQFLAPDGVVHLKTDSRFLHEYTKALCADNGLPILACTADLYSEHSHSGPHPEPHTSRQGVFPQRSRAVGDSGSAAGMTIQPEVYEVQTYYERMFLEQGYKITYLAFRPGGATPIVSPASFDKDYWRAAEGPRRTFSHR